MQYKVPQFIDVEDKIFGPFTLKQFAYLAGGAGLSVIIWRSVPISIGIFIIAPVIAFTISLMFVKPNGKPFIFMVQNFFQYIFGNKMYKWESPHNTSRPVSYTRPVVNTNTQKHIDEFGNKNITRDQIIEVAKKLNSKS